MGVGALALFGQEGYVCHHKDGETKLPIISNAKLHQGNVHYGSQKSDQNAGPGLAPPRKENNMSDYEKFRLQWMLDHGHSCVN